MTQVELASRSHLDPASISLYERTGHLSLERAAVVLAALEAAGANFTAKGVLVQGAALEHMSGEQCREARSLLGWTQQQLGAAAGITHRTICGFEARGARISPRRDFNRASKIRAALEAAGVEFITDNDGAPSVRLLKPTE